MTDIKRELKEIEVDKLKVARYQRPAEPRRWKAMSRDYDELLVGAIVVSFRDGHYWVVCGQHRVLAARDARSRTIFAVVIYGLSYQHEASLFRKNATSTKALKTIDIHHVRMEEDDIRAHSIDAALRRHGFIGFKSHGLQAVSRVYALEAQGVLDDVLAIVVKAWRRDDGAFQKGALRAAVLRALGDFLVKYPQADRGRLANMLSSETPNVLVPKYSHPDAWQGWLSVANLYNRGLTKNRLEIAA